MSTIFAAMVAVVLCVIGLDHLHVASLYRNTAIDGKRGSVIGPLKAKKHTCFISLKSGNGC